MSRDEQIEKMARSLCLLKNDTCEDCNMKEHCLMRNCAEVMYKQGYRKASDVAREVIDDCIDILNTEYRKCDTNDVKIILAMVNAIAELKKKYESEKENENT